MIHTTIPTQDYQRFERLTDKTYFFHYDAEEDAEDGMISIILIKTTIPTSDRLIKTLLRNSKIF